VRHRRLCVVCDTRKRQSKKQVGGIGPLGASDLIRFALNCSATSPRISDALLKELFLDDGLTGSYSGPEGRFRKVPMIECPVGTYQRPSVPKVNAETPSSLFVLSFAVSYFTRSHALRQRLFLNVPKFRGGCESKSYLSHRCRIYGVYETTELNGVDRSD
jgi:hypothetical protein